MKVIHSLFIIALSCVSVSAIHATKQYVTAKKADKNDRASRRVSILVPRTNEVISDNTFTKQSSKRKLFFDFSKGNGSNYIVVYDPKTKTTSNEFGTQLSTRMVNPDEVFNGEEIIIDTAGNISLQVPSSKK